VEGIRAALEPEDFEMLPPMAGLLQELVPELAARMPPLPAIAGASGTRRHQLYWAIIETLAHLGPTVCVLEDLQWADDATLEFVEFLSLHQPTCTKLVVTLREDDGQRCPSVGAGLARSRRDLLRVELAPLGTEEVRQLVGAILGTDEVSLEFAAYLRERTAGLPFAIEEVVRLIQDRRDLIRRDGHWVRRAVDALQVPPAVRDSVLERLGRLGPDARTVAKAAAVVGLPADEGLLAVVADLSPERTSNGLCEALGTAVLMETGTATYGFRHALATEAVHGSIHRPQRKSFHLRAALALQPQRPTPCARLAYHFREAGLAAKAAEWDEAAGDLAVAGHDDAAAVHFFEAALRLADIASATRVRLAVKLGRSAQLALTRHAEAAAILSAVLVDSSMEPSAKGELRHLLGCLLTLVGDASSGRAEQVASLLDLSDAPGLSALAMARLAQPGVAEGDIDDHLQWLYEAQGLAAAQNDPRVTLEVNVSRAVALVRVGDPRGGSVAAEIPMEARSQTDRHALVWAAIGLAGGSFHLGHYARTEAFLTQALRRVSEVGSEPYMPALEGLSLLHLWAVGRWDGLEEAARRHAELNGHYPSWAIVSLRVSGYLALAKGGWDEAQSAFTALFYRAKMAGVIPGVGGAAAGMTWLALRRDDPDAALAASMRGLDIVAGKRVWVWGAEIVPAAVASLTTSGRNRVAADVVDEFAVGVRDRDAPLATAALDWSRGMVAQSDGRLDDAGELLMSAAEQYGRLPRPYEEATTRAQAGTCLLEAGHRHGVSQLHKALIRFEQLGASADAARLRLDLRRNSVRVPTPWHGGRLGYGQNLSPREREVADLVTRGHTNAAIADRLYLSPRTVEHHVGSVMRKMGVGSRVEVAARWGSADPG